MKPLENTEKQLKKFDIQVNTKADDSVLNDVMQAYQKHQESKNNKLKLNTGRIIMGSKLMRLAAAACIIIAVVIGINYLVGPLSITSVGWADVVEKFKSMKFFSATIYIKENASKEPKQIEVWRNSEQKTRIRADGQVLFAQAGQITAGYNFDEKRKLAEEEYDENGLMVAKKLLSVPEFSLNTVVGSFYEGRLEEITPLMNPDAMISEDMLVFDVKSPSTPEWMRIWALRESKLPVMIRMWDPRDGGCIDVFMTYSKEQLPDFFEPSKYEKILLESESTTRGSRANLAYALLEDGGGRDYVPKELFKKEGYHMPVFEKAGITKYGAVWYVASKAQNRRPDGNVFYGFSNVTDDLGRKYDLMKGIHRTSEDISVKVFVPEGYPFDERIPEKITLHCNVEQMHPDEPEQTIGSVDIHSPEQNSSWPKEHLGYSEYDVMISKAWALAHQREYDGASKIINFIQELNPDRKYAFDIDRINLDMLISRREFAQADQLAEKNWKQEIESFIKAGPNAYPERFSDYIIAVAGNGKINRAAQMFNELKSVRPDYSKYDKSQQKKFLERLKEQVEKSAGYRLVPGLFAAGISFENVNQILGFNVLEDDTTKWYVPEEYRLANDPQTIKWNKHLEELAEYFKANPLEPGQMVFRKRPVYNLIPKFKMPGLDDYRVEPVGGMLQSYACSYKYPESLGRIKIEADLSNIELIHEVISRGQVSSDKKAEFVLSQFGLEAVEGEDICSFWVAEYNGKQLGDFKEIRSPVLSGTTATTAGTVSMTASFGFNIISLLTNLSRDQNIVIEDKTGIDKNTKLSLEIPNFKGEQGSKLAEDWYKKNFGITFQKEQRKIPVWIIRKKQ